MKTGLISAVFAVAVLSGCNAQLPKNVAELLPICTLDETVDSCIRVSPDILRPNLKKGIPELEVPAIDPMYLDEVVINPNGASFKIVGRGITVRGASEFNVFRFKSDIKKMSTFYVGVEFPFISFSGKYDMNIPTPMMRIKGAGPVSGNATMIRANAVLEAEIVKRDNKSFFKFNNIELDIKLKDYKVDFRGLFPEKFLDEMALNLINERSTEYAWMVEPLAERAASAILLKHAQRISRHLPIEDIFIRPSP